jgi:hypothetical protein
MNTPTTAPKRRLNVSFSPDLWKWLWQEMLRQSLERAGRDEQRQSGCKLVVEAVSLYREMSEAERTELRQRAEARTAQAEKGE